jgi:hypothetical protein
MKRKDLPKHIQSVLTDVLDIPSGISDTATKACLNTIMNSQSRKTCGDILTLDDTPENRDLILRANCHGEGWDPEGEEAKEEWGYEGVPVSEYGIEDDVGCMADYILHLLNQKEPKT